MLLPSVLGFALCFVCLAATTWAWFTASVTSEANNIQTASFDVVVTVFDSGDNKVDPVNGVYMLNAGEYTVALRKTGNAERAYILINNGGTESYTSYLGSGNVQHSLTLSVADDNTNVTITPKWGVLPGDTPIDIGTGIALLNEDPADENQQEEEQKNQQQEEETPSDENNPADDPENNGEGENASTDTSTDGDGNEEQQPDGSPETPDDGEQGGEQPTDEPSNTTEGEDGQQGGETSETPDVSEKTSDENNEGGNTEENPSSEEPTEQATEQDA